MVIILKPNKLVYDNPKSFCPIVLLNTIGKLIKKVIAKRLQFHVVKNDFVHSSQLGGLKFKSITDARITLTHVIQSGWVKNKTTSILAFDITQFFPSLNHHLLTLSLSSGPQSQNQLFLQGLSSQKENQLYVERTFLTNV